MNQPTGITGDCYAEMIERAAQLAQADTELRWALVQARKAAGLTQAALAEAMGVSQPAIHQFESPTNDPRLSTLRRYALAVGAAIQHRVITAQGEVHSTNGWEPVAIQLAIGFHSTDNSSRQVATPILSRAKRTDFACAA